MAQDIIIYDDKYSLCAVIRDKRVPDLFYNDGYAYEENGKVNIASNHNSDEYAFYQIPYTRFKKRNGEAAGATIEETIEYLNLQLRGEGEGGQPTIINTDYSTAESGELYQFQLEADRTVRFWSASGLPDGLHLNQVTGLVSGITTDSLGSPHTVSYAAIGSGGVGQQTHTLTVDSGLLPFINTLSVYLLRTLYTYITGGNPNSLYFDIDDPFSVSLWFKVSDPFQDSTLYSRIANNGTGFEIWIDRSGNNRKLKAAFYGTNGSISFEGSTNLSKNTWYHLVFTYDGSENTSGMNMYVNGVAETKSNTNNDSLLNYPDYASSYLHIGAKKTINALPERVFTGNIDEVSVFDIELTVLNVSSIYNSGTPISLTSLLFYSNCLEWWRFGDGDTLPTFIGQKGLLSLTAVNLTASNIINDVI